MKKISNPTAVTIGIFDGVHKGHQVILKRLIKEAKKLHLKSVAITFHPHPVKVLNPDATIPLLMSLEHRIRLIKEMGVDQCFIERFTKRFSRLNPEDFIKKVLIDKLNLKVLVTGENFLFGFKEKGNIGLLKRLSRLYNFKLCSMKPVKMNGEFISSTRIRRAIEKGDLVFASRMLGRPVTILGTVVKGSSVGRGIGFPTANIDPHHEAIPPSGVYSVEVRIDEDLYHGILNISRRSVIEVHILKFSGNIYGRSIEVIFKKRIRDEKGFKSLKDLQNQIKLDIQKTCCF